VAKLRDNLKKEELEERKQKASLTPNASTPLFKSSLLGSRLTVPRDFRISGGKSGAKINYTQKSNKSERYSKDNNDSTSDVPRYPNSGKASAGSRGSREKEQELSNFGQANQNSKRAQNPLITVTQKTKVLERENGTRPFEPISANKSSNRLPDAASSAILRSTTCGKGLPKQYGPLPPKPGRLPNLDNGNRPLGESRTPVSTIRKEF
jgi:hypothetical protein